jgi:hypothetical protein
MGSKGSSLHFAPPQPPQGRYERLYRDIHGGAYPMAVMASPFSLDELEQAQSTIAGIEAKHGGAAD